MHDKQTKTKSSGRIVKLGSVEKLTGKQPRGTKEDGGSINRLKYESESPQE